MINADKPWLFMDANGAVCVCESVYLCVFATVTWSDAPAVAAVWVLSHRLVVLQLSPLHSNQGCVESGKHILDILECDVEIIYGWLDFNHIISALTDALLYSVV